MKKQSAFIEWFKAILLAFIVVLLFRLLCYEAFTIPSPSMEKTLLPGDYIIVSKIDYGPRLPKTPLSFPFVHQKLPFTEDTKSYFDWLSLPYHRLSGSPDIERNDVVVFNYPMQDDRPVDQRIYYVKRCVAIAGDTLEIKEGQVYINGNLNDLIEKIQFNYKVKSNNDSVVEKAIKDFNLVLGGKAHDNGGYWFCMDCNNAEQLKQVPYITEVSPMLEKKGSYSDYMFPENERFLWNVDFYGPLYVPKAGDSIRISVDSLPLYERIISVYENNNLEVINDSIFINHQYTTHYKFKMNYYFMMGDSRHNSADSRFWGFVPEDHVVGKAKWTLLSVNKTEQGSKMRWDRCFKKIE